MLSAFILVLYDSGARIGEMLNLKLKNIEFTPHGAKVLLDGKTGRRRILIVPSVRALAAWINTEHPMPDNPDAYVWVNKYGHGESPINYCYVFNHLKSVAKLAGINKRVYPHLFRHSRATYLASHLTEAQMKHYFGWTQASDMAAVYVHMSGRDVDDALYRLYGIDEDPKHKPRDFIECADIIAITEKKLLHH